MTAPNRRSNRIWLATSHVSSSFGNVVLVVATAATLTAAAVGTTAIVLAAYLLALSLVRGVVGDPALLTKKVGGAEEIAGAAVLLGVLCAPIAFGILWILLPDDRVLAVTLAIVLPCLMMQDALRYIAFAKQQPKLAAISDLLWLLLTAVPAVAFVLLDSGNILAYVGVWMAGGVLASVVLLRQLHARIAIAKGWRSLRNERRLRAATTFDSLASNGVQQIALLELATLASLEATGAVRFVQACFGPVTLIFTTMYVDGLWTVRASHGQANAATRRVAARMALALTVAAILTFAALRFLPMDIGRTIAGPTFVAGRDILLLFVAAQLAAAVAAGAYSGLRFASHAADTTRVRMLWAALLVVGAAWGSSTAGASGFCVALLAANAAAAIGWWWRLGVVTRPRASSKYAGID